jgi:peptidoglycan/LPS O-acetylase OafA/YrhL
LAKDFEMNTFVGNKSRLPYLDSLRGLAALYVVFHHCYLSCWSFSVDLAANNWIYWLAWLKYGHLSVTFFIVLSGFVITLPLVPIIRSTESPGKVQWMKFFGRRAKRILPPYFAALAISIVLMVWLAGFNALKLSDVVGHLFLLQDWGVGNSFAINGPMWSIPVEWHIYFTVPLLFLGWRYFGAPITAVLCVCLAYGVLHFLPHDDNVRLAISPQYYGIFSVGAAAAFCVNRTSVATAKPVSHALEIQLIASLFICSIGIFWKPWLWYATHFEHFDLVFSIFSAFLIVWLTCCDSFVRRCLGFFVFVRLGEMSYSLYLMHGPLLVVFNRVLSMCHFDAGTKFILLSLLAVPIIVAIAYLFHVLFERPFLVSKTRKSAFNDAKCL